MSAISEYLFALDQWKLLEQWKVLIVSILSPSSPIESCILNSLKYRSVYDTHINTYSPTTYLIIAACSGHLKSEVLAYSRLEERMFCSITRLRAKILSKVQHDTAYLKYFLLNSVNVNKIAGIIYTGYYAYLLELIIVEELSPMHTRTEEMKMYIYLEKAPFIGMDIRYILHSIEELVVVSYKRKLTARQETILRSIFSRGVAIRKVQKEGLPGAK